MDEYKLDEYKLKDIQNKFENLIRPYFTQSRNGFLATWILVYLLFNIISAILIWFAIAQNIATLNTKDSRCDITSLFYYHYVLEFVSFFIGWLWIVYPFFKNRILLDELVKDISRLNHKNIYQYTAIMTYLKLLKDEEPLSIYGVKFSGYALSRLIFFLLFTVVIDIIVRGRVPFVY